MQVVPIEKGKELIILENCNEKLCHYCNNSDQQSLKLLIDLEY